MMAKEYGLEPARSIKRIVITGAESTGKTTLAQRLSSHFASPLVAEQLRLFVERKGTAPSDSDLGTVSSMVTVAQRAAGEAAVSSGSRIVISDTDQLSLLVYWHYYFSTPLDSEWIEWEPADLYLLLGDDVPWIADPGQRDGPDVREVTQRLFRSRLESGEHDFVEIAGSWDERFEAAIGVVEALVSGK